MQLINRNHQIAVYGNHKIRAYTFIPHAGGPAVAASRGSGYAVLPRLDKRVAVLIVPEGTTWRDTDTLGGDLVLGDGTVVSAARALQLAESESSGFAFSGRD